MLTVFILLLIQVWVITGLSHWILRRVFGMREGPFEFQILFGLGLVGILGHFISLFAPIDWASRIAIVLLGASAILERSYRESFYKYWQRISSADIGNKILLCLILIIACLLAAGPIIRDDSDSYHLQNVLWIRTYGTVPGLANLHSRFGFNSIWFHTTAALVPDGHLNYYTTPNTLLSLLLATFLLAPPAESEKKEKPPSNLPAYLTLALQLFIWYYWRGNIQSTNYDYYFFTSAILFFIHFNAKEKTVLNWIPWALAIPPILFCVRPIYAPALLFTFWALVELLKQRKYTKTILSIVMISGIIMLFLVRNYVLTGYPLYPSRILDIQDAPWKVPSEQLEKLYAFIQNYSIPRDKCLSEAIRFWIDKLYNYDKIFLLLGTLGLLWQLTAPPVKKNRWQLIFWMYVVLQMGVWMITSPEPRFISGIFGIGHLLLFKRISQIFNRNSQVKASRYIILMLIFYLTIVLGRKIKNEYTLYANFLYPIQIPKPETHTFTWEGVKVYIPEKWNNNWNRRCFLSNLPCVYDSLAGIKMLGNKIENGFYVEKQYDRNIP